MLSPIVPSVTEHQQVACEPIRAAVAALCGHGGDFGPSPQIHFQPLVHVWGERSPTSSSCDGHTQCFSRKVLGEDQFPSGRNKTGNCGEMMPCVYKLMYLCLYVLVILILFFRQIWPRLSIPVSKKVLDSHFFCFAIFSFALLATCSLDVGSC